MNNNTYQLIWNISQGAWVVASDLAKRGKKRGSIRREILVVPLLALYTSASFALPTGNELVAGQASVTTPIAGHLQINQTSQNAIINWQGFSIGSHESVNIQQPNASAVQLNRVVGLDPSIIQGQLSANGQVYLINPNGVIFGKTAQVDVGGLIASTHSISNADFLNGKLHFTQSSANGSVSNQGQINTPNGGVVALIGEQVTNSGSISTPQGSTVLAAGKTIDLDMKGDGLVEVKVTEAALNAEINNAGVIQANGGQVIMSAQSASQLLKTVINNEGVIEARGLVEKNGSIVLSGGDNGLVQVGGTLDVSGQVANGDHTLQGGNITVSGAQIQVNSNALLNASGDAGGGAITLGDKQSTNNVTVQAGASLEAQALDHGKAGSIVVLASLDSGAVSIAGQLDASAPKSGDGGFIETSAASVKIADSAKITTKATNGTTGTWIIDPVDFTIAASGGDMTGAALSAGLNSNNMTILSTTGASGSNGDVNVNDVVNWSANLLTLNAQRNININANLNGSGSAKLALEYGQASAGGGANDNYFINNGAQVTLPAGLNFSTQKGSSGSVRPWTVITSLGLEGSTTATDLQGINGNLNGNYVLGANIDASNTSGWNNGAGFYPLGRFNFSTAFKGNFNGLNHTISNLFINRPTEDYVGLFGWTQETGGISNTISNIGLIGGSATGYSAVGMLIGENSGSSISNSYATGNVVGTGVNDVGGLVGWNHSSGASINNSYATGNVTGTGQYVGGLVGDNDATSSVSNSYATGIVNGSSYVGGLVGLNSGTISYTYATGKVTGTGSYVGGLVGSDCPDSCIGTVSNSYWSSDVNPRLHGIGDSNPSSSAIGLSSSQMMQSSSFTSWSISSTGGSTAIWRIYEGFTAPLLRSFLMPLTVTANADSKTYDGLAYTGGNGVSYSSAGSVLGNLGYSGTSQGAINVGTYVISPTGLYSNQQGYDITLVNGDLTINAATPPATPIIDNSVAIIENIAPLVTSAIYQLPLSLTPYEPSSAPVSAVLSVKDSTDDFAGNTVQYCSDQASSNKMVNCQKQQTDQHFVVPTLKVKNSAGKVKRFQISANKQFLSLLLEDGSVRIWDFQRGDQHQIVNPNKNLAVTDISAVDNNGEVLSIASNNGIGTQDVIVPTLANKPAITEPDIRHFMSSNDGRLLLVSAGVDQLSLWDSKQNKKRWQIPYERGVVKGMALSDNNHYGAVLSRQPGAYVLQPADLQLKSLIDAVSLIDLNTGTVIKSLPNMGEQILSLRFTDNDTLQLMLVSGEVLDWAIAADSPKRVANIAETVAAVDTDAKSYAYVLPDGTVRVGNGQGHVLLSLQNKENPFKDAMLLEGNEKMLTVMANGELSLWDVASGRKLLRLFSTQQGWTVMDAYGRFDGSEEAMENFSWAANEEDIPLDSFSENYYEPGLLSNVLQNQDYLNDNPNMVKNGITLPPKVVLQLADQQDQADSVALKLDIFDRGGGIDKIHVYQNGKLLNNENVIAAQQITEENKAEHRALTLTVNPGPGKNTLKVIASNDMGIENSSTELSFDGKSKAYASSMRLLTIGIDKYSDPKLNLEYSVSDADSIGSAVKGSSKIASIKSLYNEEATKPRILAELKQLSQGAQQDVLVIYFAGHGMAVGKDWYFLPYETKMQPTVEQIASTGITATELSDIFKDSKIQHILLMVDSCYSGAGMDAFSKLQIGQHYFTRKLSRSLGITVITSATKDQEAYELKSLGHGLFTYLMAQDLKNKESTEPLTAHGIAENIVKTLPVFSKKMVGASQEPVVYTKGNDFVLTDSSKSGQTPVLPGSPKEPAQ